MNNPFKKGDFAQTLGENTLHRSLEITEIKGDEIIFFGDWNTKWIYHKFSFTKPTWEDLKSRGLCKARFAWGLKGSEIPVSIYINNFKFDGIIYEVRGVTPYNLPSIDDLIVSLKQTNGDNMDIHLKDIIALEQQHKNKKNNEQ